MWIPNIVITNIYPGNLSVLSDIKYNKFVTAFSSFVLVVIWQSWYCAWAMCKVAAGTKSDAPVYSEPWEHEIMYSSVLNSGKTKTRNTTSYQLPVSLKPAMLTLKCT